MQRPDEGPNDAGGQHHQDEVESSSDIAQELDDFGIGGFGHGLPIRTLVFYWQKSPPKMAFCPLTFTKHELYTSHMMNNTNSRDLMPDLSTREAADRLHVTLRFIQDLYAKGRLPGAYKLDPTAINSHLRIPEEAIAAIETLRRETATPQPQPK